MGRAVALFCWNTDGVGGELDGTESRTHDGSFGSNHRCGQPRLRETRTHTHTTQTYTHKHTDTKRMTNVGLKAWSPH